MSAQAIMDHAPLGAIIRFSDGAPRPSDRFRRKLADWENRNDKGRLIRKEPPRIGKSLNYPGGFSLHLGDYGSNGVVVIKFTRSFQATTRLSFEIVDLPPPGSIRILRQVGEGEELEYLAPDAAAADEWLARNHLAKVRIETVGARASPLTHTAPVIVTS
ncbi:hypothetical protein [Sphingopyxis sp.]|uniref:hypothetical protein n=1 Tax=Sphingopyxis sp. TaxID=1908224 RepID=UPI002D782BD5|nr:hypothetical protein [Sphingopyxis sp.]HET6523526.1 hypothetical protein [Sphingopyxis sp.]